MDAVDVQSLRLENIYFGYDGRPAFHRFHFRASSGSIGLAQERPRSRQKQFAQNFRRAC